MTLDGYHVDEAGDGLEALYKIDQTPPDLVVLDLMLPQISGLVVQQEIAAHVVTRQIPVVIITGSSMDLSSVAATCVLRKPITPEDLLSTVRHCLVRGAPGMGF